MSGLRLACNTVHSVIKSIARIDDGSERQRDEASDDTMQCYRPSNPPDPRNEIGRAGCKPKRCIGSSCIALLRWPE